MITLNEFEKLKLQGYIYSSQERYLESLQDFEKALKIKNDGQIYFQMAYVHVYLKNYREAQKCAQKAIENGYDAYELYTQITVGNLANMDQAVDYLSKGVDNKQASACFALSHLHFDNNLIPDMRNPLKCSEYLKMAYEYADETKKGLFAYKISDSYSRLAFFYPSLKDQFNRESLKYLKIFNDYGGSLAPTNNINTMLFNAAWINNDNTIFQSLFERFDGDSKIIFALMLLEEDYNRNGFVEELSDIPLFLIEDAAKKNNNSAAILMYAYSKINNPKRLRNIYLKAKDYSLTIPKCYKDSFIKFINCYETLMDEPNEA